MICTLKNIVDALKDSGITVPERHEKYANSHTEIFIDIGDECASVCGYSKKLTFTEHGLPGFGSLGWITRHLKEVAFVPKKKDPYLGDYILAYSPCRAGEVVYGYTERSGYNDIEDAIEALESCNLNGWKAEVYYYGDDNMYHKTKLDPTKPTSSKPPYNPRKPEQGDE